MQSFTFLLNERERETFNTYTTPKQSRSLTETYIWGPIFRRLAKLIPQDLAPNIISLTSALLLVQGWYFTETHGGRFPIFSTVFAIIMLLAWFALDQIDEFHARNIGNDYSFVQLFDHVCSSIASIFLGMTLTKIFLGPAADRQAMWYVTQIGQLVLLNKHIQALRRGEIRYARIRGPGEAVSLAITVVLFRTFVVGPEKFDDVLWKLFQTFFPNTSVTSPLPPYLTILGLVHFILNIYFFGQTFLLPRGSGTRNLLQLSGAILYLPSVIDMISRYFFGLKDFELFSETSVIIADALIVCVVTCDVVVCRMSSRQLHPIVPVLCLISVVSVPLTFATCGLYFTALFFELSFHLRLPVLSVIRNVYVDGIFDMVHIGHLKHFGRAAKLGTRLFVGVVNDEDAAPYKR
jgi:hypothetical protein